MSDPAAPYLDATARTGFPSYANLTDASKTSLVLIPCFLVIIICLWPSWGLGGWFRQNIKRYEPVLNDGRLLFLEGGRLKTTKVRYTKPRTINVLWVLKILTVLFHEMSHAIIGTLTGGRVGYISVTANEGGETYFRPSPRRQPMTLPTLASGYLCLMGCGLLGAGFDAVASKKAALVLAGYLVIACLICGSIRGKSALSQNKYRLCYYAGYIFGSEAGNETRRKSMDAHDKAERKLQRKLADFAIIQQYAVELEEELTTRDGEVSRKEERYLGLLKIGLERMLAQDEDLLEQKYLNKMVSLDIILLVGVLIAFGAILPAWLVADSVGLRFVIMFIGLFSAVYAVQDIHDDSIREGNAGGSDAHCFAQLVVTAPDLKLKRNDPDEWDVQLELYQSKLERRTKQSAWLSLSLQLLAILVTILAAVYFVQTTTAEQALESRDFLPSPWHLNSADLLEKARSGGQSVQEWGKDLLGEDETGQ